MRMFLPIKGPGGRYLTPREKLALLILGLTLVLCVLTLLAGDGAYDGDRSRNPVSAFVSLLCRTFGGGIVALYALVLVWSGLIYFKGERAVDMRPVAGRLFAALCVTLGVSGVLGIAHLETAGSLGLTVGAALGNTFGATLGFPILIVLMLLGVHLAGQGAWNAMREPVRAGATGLAPGGLGFGLKDAGARRLTGTTALPDDGDPSADERTLAVTQAVEEIERSQGVTIVDVEREDRSSVGELVDDAPEPDPDSPEAEVHRALAGVADVLDGGARGVLPDDDEEEEEEDHEASQGALDDDGDGTEGAAVAPVEDDDEFAEAGHGLMPVPASEGGEAAARRYDDDDDDDDEAGDEEESDDDERSYDDGDDDDVVLDDDEPFEDDDVLEDHDERDDDEDEDGERFLDEGDEDDEESDDDEDEPDLDDEDAGSYGDFDDEEDRVPAAPVPGVAEAVGTGDADTESVAAEDDEPGVAAERTAEADAALPPAAGVGTLSSVAQADGCPPDDAQALPSQAPGALAGADEESDDEGAGDVDPYAQGGLVRRVRQGHHGPADADADRPYTAFDWRGRPLE